MTLRLSAIAYHVTALPGWAAQEAKMAPLLDGADIALLPEYAGLEAALLGGERPASAVGWRDLAADRAADWEAQLVHLARTRGCWIAGATIPARTERGVVNRGFLVAPWGEVHHQDKLILTPYEREVLGMVAGEGLTVIDTVPGRFGMLICYDSEFPLLARALAEAGVEILLVPSCTDLPAGQTRVRQSCRARAIESQCLVAQAPLVGAVPACEIIDAGTGRAALFVPPDHGLPADGILAQGATDMPGAVTATVDLGAVLAARRDGQVGNFGHWPEQEGAAASVRVLAL